MNKAKAANPEQERKTDGIGGEPMPMPETDKIIAKATQRELDRLENMAMVSDDPRVSAACIESAGRLKAYCAALAAETDIRIIGAMRSVMAIDAMKLRAGAQAAQTVAKARAELGLDQPPEPSSK